LPNDGFVKFFFAFFRKIIENDDCKSKRTLFLRAMCVYFVNSRKLLKINSDILLNFSDLIKKMGMMPFL